MDNNYSNLSFNFAFICNNSITKKVCHLFYNDMKYDMISSKFLEDGNMVAKYRLNVLDFKHVNYGNSREIHIKIYFLVSYIYLYKYSVNNHAKIYETDIFKIGNKLEDIYNINEENRKYEYKNEFMVIGHTDGLTYNKKCEDKYDLLVSKTSSSRNEYLKIISYFLPKDDNENIDINIFLS